MKKRYAVLLAVPATLALSTGAAFAVSAGNFHASLQPVPHSESKDGGSDVHGQASMRLTGRTLAIDLSATGLTPNEPHAMHIHGDTQARNECPGIGVDMNTGDPVDPASYIEGVKDGLISLGEGATEYGPIDVSLTATGDTSPNSGLTLGRFLKADSNGTIAYHRRVVVPKDVAKNLANLHIVIHGTDLNGDGSSVDSLFQATLPVACGEIVNTKR
ncbi:MAG: hypothetical protein ABIU87_12780 [Ornithinibacter sp.]